ncbi:MAG: type II toxin-antitoxin system VapC family toxin [Gammaproteobacteria bacterium]
MIVIDASVATKWFLPEADSEQAAALLQIGEKLFAPELIRIEVASAITRRARLGELPPEHASAACEGNRTYSLNSGDQCSNRRSRNVTE